MIYVCTTDKFMSGWGRADNPMKDWIDYVPDLPPLKEGAHDSPEQGLCAMEMVAFIERLPHSDQPECVCPVISTFVIHANDRLRDGERDRLLPLLPLLVGTVEPSLEVKRARFFVAKAKEWAAYAASDAAAYAYADAYAAAYAYADAAADAAAYADAAAAYADAAAAAASAADANFDLANEYIKAIEGALAIGAPSKGFTSLERVKELVTGAN